jgi:Ca2+-transporting ATPase
MSQRHAQDPEEVVASLGVNPDTGLTNDEAQQRLSQQGLNKLVEEHEIRFLAILREEVTEPMILLLLAIGVIYGIVNQGDLTDSLTIIVIVAVLVLVEVWNEYRAKKSITALKKLSSPTATVLRNGQVIEIQTTQIVSGDVILLRQGERVPADARLLDAFGLEVNEASLTGESFPVPKDATLVLPLETKNNEQKNMIFAGTVVTKGHAKAVVTATGAATELGRIAGITKAAKEPKTPLQLSMKQLSKTLVWIAVFFSILIPVLEFLRGGEATTTLILTGLALAFVVIPEEMPIIITMVLGIGSYALSKKKALVKRLRAAETLGNVTVIASDKTGTITENKMRVESLYFDGKAVNSQDFKENEKEALKTALLASNPAEAYDVALSNPMSQAITENLKAQSVDVAELQKNWVLKNELSFDNERKLASYVYQYGNSTILISSGAPENVLGNSAKILLNGAETELSNDSRREVAQNISFMAQSGQRLLGFAYRRLPQTNEVDAAQLERNLVFVGIVGFIDPPRPEVRESVAECRKAGISVVMITGDHPETAKAIAAQIGIDNTGVISGTQLVEMSDEQLKAALKDTFVFARVTPEDKLRLVQLLRENGEIVAVTGDGINDAPALKAAHIGVAMGERGTDVAKETADMVLADDNFATIVTAVREGRKIFSNLRKGVRYYLACKIAIVSIFLLPIGLGIPLPFDPIQLIVLELFMDLAASATFVAEPEEAGTMSKPPISPKEKFMDRRMLTMIVVGALSLFAAVSATFLFTWFTSASLDDSQRLILSQTVAFSTWLVGHIFLALNFRSDREPLVKLGVFSNKVMVVWALLVAATLVVGVGLPFVHQSLRITSLSAANWVLVVGVAFVATFWLELKKLLNR